MKKFVIVSLLIFGLIIAGCNHKMSEGELFEKKQECTKYKDQIQETIQMEQGSIGDRRLEELFYSPIKNSCIYTVVSYSYPYTSKYIKDYFTNEELVGGSWVALESCDASFTGSEVVNCKQENKNKQEEIKQKIKELKGE